MYNFGNTNDTVASSIDSFNISKIMMASADKSNPMVANKIKRIRSSVAGQSVGPMSSSRRSMRASMDFAASTVVTNGTRTRSDAPQQFNNPNLEPVAGFNSLPLVHDQTELELTKDTTCALCQTSFRSIKDLRFTSKKHHNCLKCGISVCEDCSRHKLQLSQQDKTAYRTCNRCYCKMQNEALINFYQGLLQAKTSQINSLDTRKQLIKERTMHSQSESQLIEREM